MTDLRIACAEERHAGYLPLAWHCGAALLAAVLIVSLSTATAHAQPAQGPPQQRPRHAFRPIRLAQLEELPMHPPQEESVPQAPLALEGSPSTPCSYTIPLAGIPDHDIQIQGGHHQLSIVVRDAPLKDVLAALATTQKLNIVAAEDVTARISMTLEDVTLQEAMTAIVSIAGCTWYSDGGIIYVTSLASTVPMLGSLQGRAIEVFSLDYASAADIDSAIKGGMLSPVGKSYVIASASDDNRKTRESVVVEDLPANLDRIRQYIFQLDQPPRQVLVEVRVLQVELADEARHGVNFEHLLALSGHQIQLSTIGFAAPTAPQAFFTEMTGQDLTALVECLQGTTDAKTLAAPKVLVLNGQKARIQVGQQLGFRVVTTTQTSTLESVEFIDVGVVLEVTPRITRDHMVVMRVKPEVSTGNVSPETGLPEEETTEVETDVLLHDGQGIIIGGLIQEVDSNIQSKVPFLGDIQYVGKLFQRRQTVKSRREIIFALLPRVMPYHPAYQCQDEEERMRAGTPLLHGPLERYPRPWEPQLHDAVHHPRTLAD